MVDEPIITEADIKEAEDNPILGPTYFSARRLAEKFMADFAGRDFEPLIEEFTKQFFVKLQGGLDDCLQSDTESNVQNYLWRTVDTVVQGLLAGTPWILKRYVLEEHYDGPAVRAAIAKHIPQELQAPRIADLEAENAQLREDLKYYRERESR